MITYYYNKDTKNFGMHVDEIHNPRFLITNIQLSEAEFEVGQIVKRFGKEEVSKIVDKISDILEPTP